MTLHRENIYRGNLLLVNEQYPLRERKVEGLIPADGRFPDILLKGDAANILQYILAKISAGNAIVPVSGYRSVEEQTAIFQDSLKENGEEFTRQFVALPNHSEHQTGLAIDLGMKKDKIDFICPDFPYEGICDVFRKAAPDYGFIERYPKEKESITGISHEPWHFRYVGYPHSKLMNERGFSLEEYTEFIKEYREDRRLICKQGNKTQIEIYYVPADSEETRVSPPDGAVCQVSGNNVDGFVVTVWRKEDE